MDQRKRRKKKRYIHGEREGKRKAKRDRQTDKARTDHPTCSQGNATVGTRKAGTEDGLGTGLGPWGERAKGHVTVLYLSCRYLGYDLIAALPYTG